MQGYKVTKLASARSRLTLAQSRNVPWQNARAWVCWCWSSIESHEAMGPLEQNSRGALSSISNPHRGHILHALNLFFHLQSNSLAVAAHKNKRNKMGREPVLQSKSDPRLQNCLRLLLVPMKLIYLFRAVTVSDFLLDNKKRQDLKMSDTHACILCHWWSKEIVIAAVKQNLLTENVCTFMAFRYVINLRSLYYIIMTRIKK